MRMSSITLKLVLDLLKCSPKIDTQSDRIKLQKEIYLIQRCGIDLGYQYRWHIFGPYSKELTSTYYDLDACLRAGEMDYTWYSLKPSNGMDNAIKRFNELSSVPEKINSCIVDAPYKDKSIAWIEFLSSVDYLLHNKPNNTKEEDVKEYLRNKKGNLVINFDEVYKFTVELLKSKKLLLN